MAAAEGLGALALSSTMRKCKGAYLAEIEAGFDALWSSCQATLRHVKEGSVAEVRGLLDTAPANVSDKLAASTAPLKLTDLLRAVLSAGIDRRAIYAAQSAAEDTAIDTVLQALDKSTSERSFRLDEIGLLGKGSRAATSANSHKPSVAEMNVGTDDARRGGYVDEYHGGQGGEMPLDYTAECSLVSARGADSADTLTGAEYGAAGAPRARKRSRSPSPASQPRLPLPAYREVGAGRGGADGAGRAGHSSRGSQGSRDSSHGSRERRVRARSRSRERGGSDRGGHSDRGGAPSMSLAIDAGAASGASSSTSAYAAYLSEAALTGGGAGVDEDRWAPSDSPRDSESALHAGDYYTRARAGSDEREASQHSDLAPPPHHHGATNESVRGGGAGGSSGADAYREYNERAAGEARRDSAERGGATSGSTDRGGGSAKERGRPSREAGCYSADNVLGWIGKYKGGRTPPAAGSGKALGSFTGPEHDLPASSWAGELLTFVEGSRLDFNAAGTGSSIGPLRLCNALVLLARAAVFLEYHATSRPSLPETKWANNRWRPAVPAPLRPPANRGEVHTSLTAVLRDPILALVLHQSLLCDAVASVLECRARGLPPPGPPGGPGSSGGSGGSLGPAWTASDFARLPFRAPFIDVIGGRYGESVAATLTSEDEKMVRHILAHLTLRNDTSLRTGGLPLGDPASHHGFVRRHADALRVEKRRITKIAGLNVAQSRVMAEQLLSERRVGEEVDIATARVRDACF